MVSAALFHGKTFGAVALGEICRDAGVSKASFYRHFASKSELGAAVIDLHAEQLQARLRKSLGARSTGSPLTRLRGFFVLTVAWLEAGEGRMGEPVLGCPLGHLAAELSFLDEGLRARLLRVFERWEGAIEAILIEAQSLGELPSSLAPALAARELVSLALGMSLQARLRGDPSALRTLPDCALRLVTW
ncbi:MAG: TetR/AcrR family transcriptional regulator [Myxococcales bacterium]|nr:TetR/AcrR family transcriptional regulator [Myxococcales bacterium]